MHLQLAKSTIRSLRPEDAPSLARHANNRKIRRNMRDVFPHPYAESDGVEFISQTLAAPREVNFAIEVDGVAAGAIGVRLKQDVDRAGAEFGYWLGEEFWGRGIVSEIIPAFTRWALGEYGLMRLEAIVFEWNPASARILEKAGYVREGTLRRSGIKDGQVIDRHLYAFVIE